MVMELVQETLASSQFDLGYTDPFCVPEVASVFFSSCDSFLGETLEFHKGSQGSFVFDVEHGIALKAMQVNQASSHGEGEVSWFFSSCGRNLWFLLQ